MSESIQASESTPRRPVVVTTAEKGIFFGYASDTSGDRIHLTRGRNCVYWSADVHGFVGLASSGPSASCRVGPAADMEVRYITSVVEATPQAVERWEAAPWS